MPTYEYYCEHCKGKFDKFQSITAAPLKRCPTCKHKVRRLPGTGGGIIFKGKGFYATDYRSESYTKAQKSDKAPAAETGGGKTESKAGAKTGAGTEKRSEGGSK